MSDEDFLRRAFVSAVILLLWVQASGMAQNKPRPALTSEECAAAASDLAQGDREGVRWQGLVSCGARGSAALVKAFRAARTESDPIYLERLYGTMARLRDSAIFASALHMMEDSGATAQARTAATLLAVHQHDLNFGLPLWSSFTEALAEPSRAPCRLSGIHARNQYSSVPLPADHVQQLGAAIDRVLQSTSTPPLLRHFAGCARDVIEPILAASVPVSMIKLEYVCGNRFRVRNGSREWIRVSWSRVGSSRQQEFTVPPDSSIVYTADSPGATRLHFSGKVVRTAPNAGRPCKPGQEQTDVSTIMHFREAFRSAGSPRRSDLSGAWVLIKQIFSAGYLGARDGRDRIEHDVGGLRRAPADSLEWVLVFSKDSAGNLLATSHTVWGPSGDTSSVTFTPDGALTFEKDYAADFGMFVFHCRMPSSGRLLCLHEDAWLGLEFRKRD